jgi:hypothetical protein
MRITEAWPLLQPSTREWLIEHNGEPLTPEIAAEIVALTGDAGSAMMDDTSDGALLADEAVDWIETIANDE